MIVVKYIIPFLVASSSLFSLTSEWHLDKNGNWAAKSPTLWSAGVPNTVDDVAEFFGIITAARVISLSQATTVGALSFNNNNAYTINANTLTLQTSTGHAQIHNTTGTGSHSISSNVVLASPLVVSQNVASGKITFSGVISGSQAMTINGTGDVEFSGIIANTYTGLTTVNLTGNSLRLNKTAGVVAVPGDIVIVGGTVDVVANEQISNSATVTVNKKGATFSILGGRTETIGHLNYQVGTLNIPAGNTFNLSSNSTALTLGNNVTVKPAINFTGSGSIVMSPLEDSDVTLAGALDLGKQLHEVHIPAGVAGLKTTGIISGDKGGFRKEGPGNFELNGSVNNTYSGVTVVNAGTVTLNQGTAIAIPGDVVINGGTLTLVTSEQIAETSTMIIRDGSFNMGGFNETIDRLDFISGTIDNFTGTLTLRSPSIALQMSGGVVFNEGTVDIANESGGIYFDSSGDGTAHIGNINFTTAGNHSFNIENGSATSDMQVMGVLGGVVGANIIKEGDGSLECGGETSNTFGGTLIINGGAIRLNKTGGAFSIPADAGNITINAGSLEVLGSQQIASNKTIIVNDGRFLLHGNNQTLEALSYLGGVVMQDEGVLTLSSAENSLIMGATTINGDVIIQSGGPITFNGTAGTAIMNGTLTLAAQNSFNINDGADLYDMVINSTISDLGGVSKTGLGTLVLLGANNYTGKTIVTQGTLQGNTTSLPPVATTITSPGTLIFDQSPNGTFLGTLAGSGDMIKQGTGILRFSTPQIIGGTTTVAKGTLLVNSTLGGEGPLNVNIGAVFGGIGTIDKNVTINGTLAPGDNGIGTMTLNGTQTVGTGSTLSLELTPTTSDMLDITGTITIQPNATLLFFQNPAVYIEPLNYTVIQTTEGRTGTFDHVADPFPLFFGTLSYDPNNVHLSISLLPISDIPGLSGKAQKVARCLDESSPPPESDLYDVITSLRFVASVESIEQSLIEMQPSLFVSLATIKQESTLYVRNALFNRLASRTHAFLNKPQGYHFWGTPLMGVSEEKNHGNEAGYYALTPGATVGVDGWLLPNCQMGGSLGYTNSDVRWKNDRGSGRVQAIYAALYSRLNFKIAFLESAVILGYDWYATQREIHIEGLKPLHRRSKASHYGWESSAHIKGALQLCAATTLLGPYASLDYQYQYEGRFDESGAKSLNLNISKKQANFLQSEVGMDITQCFRLERKTLTPYIQVAGVWETRLKGAQIESSLVGSPLGVYGYYRSRFLVGAGGGLDVKWKLKTAPRASLNYKGKYGLGYQDHTFSLILIY